MTGSPADKLEQEVGERCQTALDNHRRTMRDISKREMQELAESARRTFEHEARRLHPIGFRLATYVLGALLAGALGGASAALIVFLTLP